ncbi:hypothetical protein F5141DRAFT_1190759 [Pisolithus sp. B1]|nr:hypothetical protein F5141DRAFT_1190759 [Pisolithus sp. B1]
MYISVAVSYMKVHALAPKAGSGAMRDIARMQEGGRQQTAVTRDRKHDAIARDPSMHGATFVPIILGSEKMTVSVATRQNNYWLVYLSVGNIHNNVQHAHHSGVELLTFLTIPKVVKKYTDNPTFWHFKKQLFHIVMSKILGSLKACMMVPWVMKCPDGHFHHIICSIGPHIADYLEQVLISGIVQNWCGRCTASPDDLDAGGPPCMAQLMRVLIKELQASATWDEWGIDANIVLIKGGFKDHLMEWVGKYLEFMYGKAGAKEWLADIDCQFPDGQGFSQWTGNDSKALMKVLDHFHQYHEIFWEVGMCIDGFSLPHQHSLVHYGALIHLFGAPNGLCMSIMESKHIIAVKKPWQWSSKHNALGQMLWTNQCLTQLATACADYEASHGHTRSVPTLAIKLGIPMLSRLISQFLYEQLHCEPVSSPSLPHCLPVFTTPLKVFHLATATFMSPSDPSRIGSM